MKFAAFILALVVASCGATNTTSSSDNKAAASAPLRFTDAKVMRDAKLEALREFVMTDNVWHDGAWGRFGNCHYQAAKQFTGDASDLSEVTKRVIYGKRHVSYNDFKNDIQDVTRVARDQAGVTKLYKAMINNSKPTKSTLADTAALAKKLGDLLSATSRQTGLVYFTARESWLGGDINYTVAVIIDTINHQALAVASGSCDFPQPPME